MTDEILVEFRRSGNVVVRTVKDTIPDVDWETNEKSPKGFLPIEAKKELNTKHGRTDSET